LKVRRAERIKTNGHWLRLVRVSGSQGEQIVNLRDVSSLGASFLDLSGRPYTMLEEILITASSYSLPVLPMKAQVRHISKITDDEGDLFVVGLEFCL
jgi:hypothetical protein